MSVWAVIDRIFGIVVPLCMVALVVLAWLLLSSTCESELPALRLRVVPKSGSEPLPPNSRRADTSRARDLGLRSDSSRG